MLHSGAPRDHSKNSSLHYQKSSSEQRLVSEWFAKWQELLFNNLLSEVVKLVSPDVEKKWPGAYGFQGRTWIRVKEMPNSIQHK